MYERTNRCCIIYNFQSIFDLVLFMTFHGIQINKIYFSPITEKPCFKCQFQGMFNLRIAMINRQE